LRLLRWRRGSIPEDLPNRRTDGRACDESYAGASQDLQGMLVSFGRLDGRRL
jgi:hypothetical protein